MRRVAVKIAYLGQDFSGSQYQPGFRTVVGDIIQDLMTISEGRDAEWFNIKMASRTDCGVNALDNVAVFNIDQTDDFELLRALNCVSRGIFYKSIAEVDDTFNPRYANERVYRYILPSKGIDFKKAEECARLFLGEHDFLRFCKLYDKSTVMTIDSIELEQRKDSIVLTFKAQFFLWNMIRKISSAISSVGRGRRSIEDVKRALNGEYVNFGLARPDALTLTEVYYDYIEFKEPPIKGYRRRITEERLAVAIKDEFYSHL